MEKRGTKEAYFEKIRNLAGVKDNTIKESNPRTLGTLIDNKKAGDGINYGIIKENHHYYIKKAGNKANPDVSDFSYIGGLENITSYQYKTLAEADKNRNMIFNSISGANSFKPNKTKTKMVLNEDTAEKEIDLATEKVGDLDAATAAEKTEPEVGAEEIPPVDNTEGLPEPENKEPEKQETEPESDIETDDDGIPSLGDEGGEEPKTDKEGEVDIPGETDTEGGEKVDEPNREIEKSIGKLTNTIRKTEMTDSQVKSYLNSFIAAFRDKLPDIEIEDRKEMANKILKVTNQEDINDLENSMPNDEVNEEQCDECGGFTQYAESRGYDKDSIKECGGEEMSNLVSGYANAHNDGQNDGDLETVAIFITPEILDSLKNEYGHNEYAEKLTPYSQNMNEMSDEDKAIKINELNWGGSQNAGVSDPANIETQPNEMKEDGEEPDADDKGGESDFDVDDLNVDGDEGGEENSEEDAENAAKSEPIGFAPDSQNLGLNTIKPMTAPVTTETIPQSTGLDINISPDKSVNIKMNEDKKPSAGLSKEKKSEVVKKAKAGEDIGKKGKGFEKLANKAAKEYGSKESGEKVAAAAMWKNIKKEGEEKEGEQLSEAEIRVRKYIRNRLEEKVGLRKATLNESTKSPKLKQLDNLIDSQFKLFESIEKKPSELNEILGFSVKEKFAKLNPDDQAGVENLFKSAFSNILINPTMGAIGRAAKTTPTNVKYDILKQYVENGGGTLRLGGNGLQFAPQTLKNKAIKSDFGGGGTGGGNFAYGGSTGT